MQPDWHSALRRPHGAIASPRHCRGADAKRDTLSREELARAQAEVNRVAEARVEIRNLRQASKVRGRNHYPLRLAFRACWRSHMM